MDVITKTCTKCDKEQTVDEFVKDSTRPDGRYPICKTCRRDYYTSNSETIRVKNQAYRDKNRAQVREWNKRWAIRRFFCITANNLKNRASGPSADLKELAKLWKVQHGACAMTGRRLNRENAQLDHIVPMTRGGESTINNLRWVHRDVNYAKRDLLDADFIALCQEIAACNVLKGG